MTAGLSKRLSVAEANFPPSRTLSWPRSDAKGRYKFPTNTEQVVTKDGIWDFLKLLAPFDSAHVSWRRKIAEYLAETVDKKGLSTLVPFESNDIQNGYIMEDFPEGYEMYDHHKGPPSGPVRHDIYLFGPDNSVRFHRFRSVNEFLPHARWLYDQASNDPCLCKYCGNNATKSQREITASLGVPHLVGVRAAGPRQVIGPSRHRRIIPQVSHPAIPPRRWRFASLPTPSGPRKEYVLGELHADLTQPRAFRKGELVWAAIEPSLEGSQPGESISMWPGVIKDHHLHIQFHDTNPMDRTSLSTPRRRFRSEVYIYEVNFLATSQCDTFHENKLLPMSALRVAPSLVERLIKYNLSEAEWLDLTSVPSAPLTAQSPKERYTKECRNFKPVLKSAFDLEPITPSPTFEASLPAFILAVRVSDLVAESFRPDSEWGKMKGTDDLDSATPTSLRAKSPFTTSPIVAPRATVKKFQGLWWGCERIWIGDLVRLRQKRYHFNDATQAALLDPVPEPYSQGRAALFLQIEMITKDEGDGIGSGHCVVGSLYEAVRGDWVEPCSSPPIISSLEAETGAITDPNGKLQNDPHSNSPSGPVKVVGTTNNSSGQQTLANTHPLPDKPTIAYYYPLPDPPPRSRWRLVHSPMQNMTVPIANIAGRYYPELSFHPASRISDKTLDDLIGPDPAIGTDRRPPPQSTLSSAPNQAGGFDAFFSESPSAAISRLVDGEPSGSSSSKPISHSGSPEQSQSIDPEPSASAHILSLCGLDQWGYEQGDVKSLCEGRAEIFEKADEMANDELWEWLRSVRGSSVNSHFMSGASQ